MKAFIFTGQGNEYKQMAKDLYDNSLYAKQVIDNLNLKFDFKKVYINQSNLIHDTRYAQVGNFIISIILAKLLNDVDIYADVCAGLSLGEYTSLCYSKVISINDIVSILEKRANIMYEELNGKNTGMMAIMFLDIKKIEKIISNFNNIWITNYNSPDQIIIAGDNIELEKARKLCIENGAKKVVNLDVIGAFHSKLLKNASKKLTKVLADVAFNKPKIPIYYNYIGDKSSLDIKKLLTNQLYNPVKFEQIILNMIKDGTKEFYVIGIGKAPYNFIRSIAIHHKLKLKIVHVGNIKDIEVLKK